MICGHDFKYCIPEMDRLLGAAADLGILFSYGSENISCIDGSEFLIQVVNVRINKTVLQLTVSSEDVHARKGVKVVPFPTKEPTPTRKNKVQEGIRQ